MKTRILTLEHAVYDSVGDTLRGIADMMEALDIDVLNVEFPSNGDVNVLRVTIAAESDDILHAYYEKEGIIDDSEFTPTDR